MQSANSPTPARTILDHHPAGRKRTEPFPYIVFDDVLPPDMYQALAATYPDPGLLPDKLKRKNNHRFNLVSGWGAAEYKLEDASPEWREFITAHTSPRFVAHVLQLFPEYCEPEAKTPSIDVDSLGKGLAKELKIEPTIGADRIVARATVACNTPVTRSSRVRGVHTDARRKAYVGLLYFRLPEDDSEGGDLEIHRWKDPSRKERWPMQVGEGLSELAETVAYKANRLVLFVTAHDALHAVSPRAVTPHFRRLVVVSGWLPEVDYHDTDTTHGRLSNVKSALLARLRRTFGQSSRWS